MLSDIKIVTATDYSSGVADVNGAAVSVSGYEGVIAVVKAAAVATGAVTSVELQCSDTAAFTAAYAITGGSISVAADDDNQIFAIEVMRPPYPYVRVVINKDATNAVAESSLYILFGPGYKPQANTVADKMTTVSLYQPAATLIE